jgi:Zinc finger, C2H2 type
MSKQLRVCPHCDKALTVNTGNYYRHIRLHTNPFICTVPNCDKKFGGQLEYEMHLGKHIFMAKEVVVYKRCQYESCNKKFKTTEELIKHKDTYHSIYE